MINYMILNKKINLPTEIINIIFSYSYSPQNKELLDDIRSFYELKKKACLINEQYELQLKDFLFINQQIFLKNDQNNMKSSICARFHRYNKFLNICFRKNKCFAVYAKLCHCNNYFNIFFGLLYKNERIQFIDYLNNL